MPVEAPEESDPGERKKSGNKQARVSLATTRERRQPKQNEKQDKFAAIRAAREKGEKVKYQYQELQPVYDMVPEEEYAKIVSDRQMDQFVDMVEGASEEYVDHGGEIFDDETDDASVAKLMKGQHGKKGGKSGGTSNGKGSDKEEVKSKPAVRSGDIRNMFQAVHSKAKKEPESITLKDRERDLADLLEEMNGDIPDEEADRPKPSEVLFGKGGPTMDEFLAPGKDDGIFKRSMLRRKPKTMSTTSGDFEDPSAASAPRKRPLPDSPIEVGMFADFKHRASCSSSGSNPSISEAKRPLAGLSLTGSAKRSKVIPPVPVEPRVAWAEESNDTSNASYELDPTFKAVGGTVEDSGLDDGWIPDAETEALLEPVVIKPAPRLATKIEKKWTVSDAPPRPPPPLPQVKIEEEEVTRPMDMPQPPRMVGPQTALRIFWLDACEDLAIKGCVNLFGKTYNRDGVLVSVCVKVMSIERLLFFLMREKIYDSDAKEETEDDVTSKDVQKEFRERIMPEYRIGSFRSMQKTKKYAFEKTEVPDEAEYLEVRYPFSDPVLPEDLTGSTFSHIFGRNTSALEIFLLERKIKGPCWLDLDGALAASTKTTWCLEEYLVLGSNKVTPSKEDLKPPGVVIMSLQLKIVVDPKTKHNEVAAAAALVHHNFPLNTAPPKQLFNEHFSLLAESPQSGRGFPMRFRQEIEANTKYQTKTCDGEKSLLDQLLQRIQKIDPDIIVLHDAVGYQLDILLHRLHSLMKGQSWSRLGRLKRTEIPKGRNAGALAATGRLICDVKHSAEELIHTKSYDMTELVQVVLREKTPRQDIDSEMVGEMYRSKDNLERLVDHTLNDALYTMRIMAELNALPLALQITNIAGNILSRTLLGGRSERNEFLLLHAFSGKNYICPDKQFREFHKKTTKKTPKAVKSCQEDGEEQTDEAALVDEEKENLGDEIAAHAETGQGANGGKRKPAYAGGLVLDPKKGLYDTFVLLMDFNSLYPSIIQEYNICFTTIDRKVMAAAENQDDYIPPLPESNAVTGVLPTEIKILVERRQEVKKLIKQLGDKESDKRIEYDIRQKALKLTANSMYGCLGFTMSRFFARPLAALITMKGREILMNTKELIEKLNLEVIYGDTDSVMINTRSLDFDAVLKIGSDVKRNVDRHYKSLVLDVDGIFRSLLLLQKKKYAALIATKKDGKIFYTRELKGLDIVRRDWSPLAAETGRFVIDQILSDPTSDQAREDVQGKILTGLKNVGEFMKTDLQQSLFEIFGRKGYFEAHDSFELFVIMKQLNKDPHLYADAKSLPHVQVAQRWNSFASNKKLRHGDTIPYVICNEVPPGIVVVGGKKAPHTQRAYHIEEFRANRTTLSIDKQYYLAEQIHKVVNRLCEPIDGVDAVVVAECLGIDRSVYGSCYVDHSALAEEEKMQGFMADCELYKDCEPLTLVCPGCGNNWIFDEPILEKDGQYSFSLQKCQFCEQEPIQSVIRIRNVLRIRIGQALQRYYKTQFTCQDASCFYQCSFVPPKFHRGQPVCPACEKAVLKPAYSDRELYLQLCFWRNAFDPQRALEKIKNKPWHGSLALTLKQNPELLACFEEVSRFVQSFLDKSAYGRVTFSNFFPRSLGAASSRALQ
ncbi:DNA polymerase alpha catalytic subunit [Hypsibius exemplaris]|uniref:DNA polymerase n=1 Tax=Hypsibius exemplaris TaxID=2072580 RepID=A0A1W0WC42_HYPEX|nr:DNA polymerase alpha catalytic subunit [Hypsibius exemplaris]